jgi:aspartate carbamoyltransferase catalytic subunit
MPRDILQATDLDLITLQQLFARADGFALESQPVLRDKTIAFALWDDAAAPITSAEAAINGAGGEVKTLEMRNAPPNAAELARLLDALNADAVLLSHPEAGQAKAVADGARAPLLNAGDGGNENVVRALLDLYAIRTLKETLTDLRVALLGDLKSGAEAHSLARLLVHFPLHLSFVSPAALSMPYDLTDELRAAGMEVEETNDLPTTLRKADVLYLSRLDPRRVESRVYQKAKDFYDLTPTLYDQAKPGLVALGEWDDAQELLRPTRERVTEASHAMLLALLEYAMT